jgi:hypothetical protein
MGVMEAWAERATFKTRPHPTSPQAWNLWAPEPQELEASLPKPSRCDPQRAPRPALADTPSRFS